MRLTYFLFAASMALPIAAAAADGKAIYQNTCSACHGQNGDGIPNVFPPLRQSDYVKKAAPAQLAKIVSQGLNGKIVVNGKPYNSMMPPLTLNDADTAAVLNYVLTDLNGAKAALTPDVVKKARTAK